VPRVLMVSSEVAPYAKTGGLADVVGSLPAALGACGQQAAVVAPRYASVELAGARRVGDLRVPLGARQFAVAVYQAGSEFPLYLLDCPELYARRGFYGSNGSDYPDNHVRFALLARGALEVARQWFPADIFHCHDWQAGLVPAYLRTVFGDDPAYRMSRTLFTIHNLAYPGLFPAGVREELGLDASVFTPEGMEFYGQLSFIKGGIRYADALSTVSPTYAREILTPEFGCGLDGVLRGRASDLTGILNGVDYRVWNPETDVHLPAHYSVDDLSGKRVCKRKLIEEVGLRAEAMERPLLGMVSRFTAQKGTELVVEAAEEMIGEDVYLVALGTGEVQERMRRLEREHPGRVAVRIGFDTPLAHRIEAGSDVFLMPSRWEPSGLNQMYSLRYGTPPVVHATGGLDDTIDGDTGFKFTGYSSQRLAGAVSSAVAAFGDREAWRRRMRRGMRKDFSWGAAAEAYAALYQRLLWA
jgi:starch synthase